MKATRSDRMLWISSIRVALMYIYLEQFREGGAACKCEDYDQTLKEVRIPLEGASIKSVYSSTSRTPALELSTQKTKSCISSESPEPSTRNHIHQGVAKSVTSFQHFEMLLQRTTSPAHTPHALPSLLLKIHISKQAPFPNTLHFNF